MAVLQRVYDEQSFEERLQKNGVDDLKELCDRLQLHEEWVLSNLDYPAFFDAYFAQHYETVLMLLSQDELQLLLRIWNQKEVLEFSEINQRHLTALEKLGFLRFQYQEKKIIINREAEHNLYFYLKSKTAGRLMRDYQRLEEAIKGVLYQFGIISISDLYHILVDGPVKITPGFLREFCIGRINLWSFAGVLKNRIGEYYLECFEVSNRQRVFDGWIRESLEFAQISFEEAEMLGKAGGIGMWEGTPEMIGYCMDTLIKDSVATTILAKRLILYIQNDLSMEQIITKVEKQIENFTENERGQFEKLLCLMYDHVPLYHLKGHSRSDLRPAHGGFVVIPGGLE